jgi:hypothetical protein
MEAVAQGLVPGVEYGQKAELSPQMGPAKLQQGLGGGLEEEVADDFFIGFESKTSILAITRLWCEMGKVTRIG